MQINFAYKTQRLPWYGWLLAPLVLPANLVVAMLFGILSLFSILFFFVFPEHHLHPWDMEGTPHQRKLLAKWRSHYAHLGFIGRIRRAFTRLQRGRGPSA